MLPAASRMRRGEDFALAVRRGRRAGSTHLAVHLATSDVVDGGLRHRVAVTADGREDAGVPTVPVAPPQVGLVVSKAVGNAVARTRVKRRLRALAAHRLDRLPPGSLAVLRANPPSARASSAVLGADLDRALDRVLRPRRVGT